LTELTPEQIQKQIDELKKQLPKKPRKPKKFPVAINDDEFFALIKATEHERHKVAFLLGYGSGMRVSEVVKLIPENIHIKEKNILISQGKGSKDRIVPLAKGFKTEHIKLFPLGIGVRALQKAFKISAEKAGLLKTKPSLHFHSLRHGFATNAVGNKIPIHHVRTLMGHSNISTTNIYLEMNPQEALKSYEELF